MTNRRTFLSQSFWSLGMVMSGSGLDATLAATRTQIDKLGPLQKPDINGLRLPKGFKSRIIAVSGQKPIKSKAYVWHPAPDGGAVFAAPDGGWVYVSNSEYLEGQSGAGAIRFDSKGNIIDAYSILSGTYFNCAGGATPWNTWISCEEHAKGRAWECDPFGKKKAIVRPALGVFAHEAVAVDPEKSYLYMTEDMPDGRLYRFTPKRVINGRPDLSEGKLEALKVLSGKDEGKVTWLRIPDPSAKTKPTRMQIKDTTAFNGGEGIWFDKELVYFTTKGDNRVWKLDTKTNRIKILYDVKTSKTPILSGVDNVTMSASGDLLVAEDGGDMQVVAITPSNKIRPLLEIKGQDKSEITGIAFDPSGSRLYLSSQLGHTGKLENGITYEVTGPFNKKIS